jgi:hypothetical protein
VTIVRATLPRRGLFPHATTTSSSGLPSLPLPPVCGGSLEWLAPPLTPWAVCMCLDHQRRAACAVARREGVVEMIVTWPRSNGVVVLFIIFSKIFAQCQMQH